MCYHTMNKQIYIPVCIILMSRYFLVYSKILTYFPSPVCFHQTQGLSLSSVKSFLRFTHSLEPSFSYNFRSFPTVEGNRVRFSSHSDDKHLGSGRGGGEFSPDKVGPDGSPLNQHFDHKQRSGTLNSITGKYSIL